MACYAFDRMSACDRTCGFQETELKTEELRQQHRNVQGELKACR